jgi:hypothetical protein
MEPVAIPRAPDKEENLSWDAIKNEKPDTD